MIYNNLIVNTELIKSFNNYIDKSLFSQIHQWAWTSLIMLIYIIVSVLIVSKYLQIFSKYGRKTSIFSAAPGALGPLMILAEDEKSDLSQVATSHLIRLIIIITIFPFGCLTRSTFLTFAFDLELRSISPSS